jgi:predicted kinase
MQLILVRGLPGSGKTTYARSLGIFHVEADMYFVSDGTYRFDPRYLNIAHHWCQKTAIAAMRKGMDVVVSNTFSQMWEMQPYIEAANDEHYKCQVICCTGAYTSQHNLPRDIAENMRKRWEDIAWEVKL